MEEITTKELVRRAAKGDLVGFVRVKNTTELAAEISVYMDTNPPMHEAKRLLSLLLQARRNAPTSN